MIRGLLRLVIVLVILVGAAAFFLGWWGSGRVRSADSRLRSLRCSLDWH